MATPQWIKDLLVGGLPEVLDLGDQAGTQPTPTPEQVRPTDLTGRDNVNPPANFLMSVTQGQILTATAVVLGVLGVVWLARNA